MILQILWWIAPKSILFLLLPKCRIRGRFRPLSKINSHFKASCNTCKKLILRSRAAALSQAGNATVRFTDRLTFTMRIEGIYTSTSTAQQFSCGQQRIVIIYAAGNNIQVGKDNGDFLTGFIGEYSGIDIAFGFLHILHDLLKSIPLWHPGRCHSWRYDYSEEYDHWYTPTYLLGRWSGGSPCFLEMEVLPTMST